jgi:(p)ppGpp synthase/HD superfamily hydrolase
MTPTLDWTEAFVVEKFAGQFDKSDVPMSEHMRRVAYYVADQDEATQHAAWLHDIVEDTDVTVTELISLDYPTEVIDAVVLLTHDKKQMTYADYIDRICQSKNRRAIIVKLADQKDNLDPMRWLRMNRYMQNALRKRYAGVQEKLINATMD